jgi:hypothetical protein
MHPADGRSRILIGSGRDCAGIQNHDIGFSSRSRPCQSLCGKLPFNGSTVGLGGAAAKILYVIGGHQNIIKPALSLR